MTYRIAVLGLGTMGGRAAVALTQAGHSIRGYDPSAAAAQRAAEQGVDVVTTLSDAVAGADLVLTSVPLPEHVRALAEEIAAAASPGTDVLDLSTIDPGTAREAAEILAAAGIAFADAPVLGRPAGCGAWTLVVGGPEDLVERVSPHLVGTIAKAVVRVGDVGAGSVVKLANNLMFGAINAVTAEAIGLCEANGVDPAAFVSTVADSGAATVSPLFRDVGPRMVSGDFTPTFALGLLAKDNRLALEVQRAAGLEGTIADAVHRANSAGLELGFGDRDSAVLREAFRRPAPTAS